MDELLSRLPGGWYITASEEAKSLHSELQREIPPGHLLYGRKVTVIARRHDRDDILCWHIEQPERLTIIHLSGVMRQEVDDQYPGVEMDGDVQAFFVYAASMCEQ